MNAQNNEENNAFLSGQKLIGGSIYFNSNNNETEPQDTVSNKDSYERNYVSINPYIGKFIKDNLLIGFSLNYYYLENKNEDYFDPNIYYNNNDFSHTLGAEVFLKKYYSIKGKFGAYIRPYVNYSISSGRTNRTNVSYSSVSNQNTKDKSNSAGLGLDAGLYLRIGNKFIFETNLDGLSANYSNRTSEFDNSSATFDRSSKNLNLKFVNTMSFDQIIRINYIF